MAERASIFEDAGEFDVKKFTVKPPSKKTEEPDVEQIREASEAANFKSREPKQAAATAANKPNARGREQRRHRTGRNIQLSLKVDAETDESFYQLTERCKKQFGWVSGETLKRALTALNKELAASK